MTAQRAPSRERLVGEEGLPALLAEYRDAWWVKEIEGFYSRYPSDEWSSPEARSRAMKLLITHLTREQVAMFTNERYIPVSGPGGTWRVLWAAQIVTPRGHTPCLHPPWYSGFPNRERFPLADLVLAEVLAIRHGLLPRHF